MRSFQAAHLNQVLQVIKSEPHGMIHRPTGLAHIQKPDDVLSLFLRLLRIQVSLVIPQQHETLLLPIQSVAGNR